MNGGFEVTIFLSEFPESGLVDGLVDDEISAPKGGQVGGQVGGKNHSF